MPSKGKSLFRSVSSYGRKSKFAYRKAGRFYRKSMYKPKIYRGSIARKIRMNSSLAYAKRIGLI